MNVLRGKSPIGQSAVKRKTLHFQHAQMHRGSQKLPNSSSLHHTYRLLNIKLYPKTIERGGREREGGEKGERGGEREREGGERRERERERGEREERDREREERERREREERERGERGERERGEREERERGEREIER